MSTPTHGEPNDFLYIILGKKFYRLSYAEITKHHEIGTAPKDGNVVATLKEMEKEVGILADIPLTKSCICVALNLDYDGFHKSLTEKNAMFAPAPGAGGGKAPGKP